MEVATTDQILPMVRCNLGIGFCPEGIARPAIERKEVFEIELEEEIPERQITIVEDSGKPQSIAVQKLLTYLNKGKSYGNRTKISCKNITGSSGSV